MLQRLALVFGILLAIAPQLAFTSEEGLWLIRGTYGTSIVNPQAANKVIDDENALLVGNGYSGFSLPQVTSLWGPDIFLGYKLSPLWDLGLSYSSFTSEIAASGTKTAGTRASETISGGYQTIAFRSHYYFYRQEQFLLRFGTSLGVGMYNFRDVVTVGSATGTATLSKTAFAGRAALGLDFLISPSVGLSFDAGYSLANSGALKVESQSNMGLTVGQTPTWDSKDAEVDFSGPFFLASLTFRLNLARQAQSTEPPVAPASIQITPATPETRAPSSLNPPESSIEEKLNRLKGLKDRGLITDDEYQQRRKTLLDQLVE